MDGFTIGKPRSAGNGGVLRDYNDKYLCIFSGLVGVLDWNEAEFLFIEKALSIILKKPSVWRDCVGIVLESYSKNAVSWASSSGNHP